MSLLLCRFIHRLHYYPKSILGVSLLFTILAFFAINNLKWEFKLLQLFSQETPSRIETEEFERQYGGFGMLTLVSEDQDPQVNATFLAELSDSLQNDVHFAEYQTESEFFNKNKLLYIQLSDLELIRDRIFEGIHKAKMRANPFIIPLVQDNSPQSSGSLELNDLQKKYQEKLLPYLGSEDQKTLVLRLYPRHDITNLEENQALYDKTKALVQKLKPPTTEVQYTGGILENIRNQELVSREIKNSLELAGLFILGGMLIFFYRQPLIPLIATIPIAIAMIWTLGVASLIFGKVSLISLVLGVVLIGVGTDSIIHLLARYGEERRKGLGPFIAFENIILETGPTITLSTFTTAIGFFALRLMPFEGLQEFGTLAGIALILSWVSSLVFFPAVLLLIQRSHVFKVYGRRIKNHFQFEKRPFKPWSYFLIISVFCIVSLFAIKWPLKVNENLEYIGFTTNNLPVDKKLKELKLDLPAPAIFKTSSPQERQELAAILKEKAQAPGSLIKKIQTFENVLPNNQDDKLDILEEIRELLTPQVLSELEGSTKSNAELILQSIKLEPITLEDLPLSFKKRFQGKNQGVGEYIFVFPKHNTNDGELNREFAQELRRVELKGKTIYSTGKSILIADFLDSTLPYVYEVIAWSLLGILLLLAFEISIKDALSVIFCVGLALGAGMAVIQQLDLEITPLNILIFPLILGYCFDGTLHIHQRYREEATGSIPFVMRRTGSAVLAATLTTSSGFLGFALSQHPGLSSIGYFALLGTICSLLASLVILPTLISWGDLKRWRDQQKLLQ